MPYRQRGGCPKCGGSFLNLRTKNYSYQRCSKCIGIWMEWDVLTRFIEDIEPGFVLETAGSHEGRMIPCPTCRGSMARTHILTVPVDYCKPHNHGVWFDKDELRQVLERVATSTDAAPEAPTSFTTLLNDFFNKRAP
jgi:Zn-finger nucleic acid-binding protein